MCYRDFTSGYPSHHWVVSLFDCQINARYKAKWVGGVDPTNARIFVWFVGSKSRRLQICYYITSELYYEHIMSKCIYIYVYWLICFCAAVSVVMNMTRYHARKLKNNLQENVAFGWMQITSHDCAFRWIYRRPKMYMAINLLISKLSKLEWILWYGYQMLDTDRAREWYYTSSPHQRMLHTHLLRLLLCTDRVSTFLFIW